MLEPDDLSGILERIAKDEYSTLDLQKLRDFLNQDDQALSVLQSGKYPVNIQQALGEIHIGDRSVHIDEDAVQRIVSAIQAAFLKTEAISEEIIPAATALSQQDRTKLIQTLYALMPQQLNMLIFTVNPPAGIIPPTSAPVGDRASSLLAWAEGPGGCSLDHLQKSLADLLNH